MVVFCFLFVFFLTTFFSKNLDRVFRLKQKKKRYNLLTKEFKRERNLKSMNRACENGQRIRLVRTETHLPSLPMA